MLSLQEGNLSAAGDKEEAAKEQVMRNKGEKCGYCVAELRVKRQALLSALGVGNLVVAFLV